MSHIDPIFDPVDQIEHQESRELSPIENMIQANFTETNLRMDYLLDDLKKINNILKDVNEKLSELTK